MDAAVRPALGGRQHLAVEFLHSGLKPGQVQKSAVGGNLFQLRAINCAAHFGVLGVHQFGDRSDHALQLDVAGGGCCRLNSDQNVGRLKAFRLHVQNIFSGRQVSNRVRARRTGCRARGLAGYFVGDSEVSPADRGASGPGNRSGNIAGGGILREGQR